MDRLGTPALALALFDAAHVEHVTVLGDAVRAAHVPATRETLFQIGSITKSFTALAIAQAAEAGRLDLQAPLTYYLPWFRVQTRYSPITLHHLLTHTAGLIGITDRSPDMRSAVWALRETETAWAPGERFWYSDAGFQTLALILERLSGQSFDQVLRAQIFEPLGMANSFGAVTYTLSHRLARGERPVFDDRPVSNGMPLVLVPFIEISAGDCSVAATIDDMARFGQLLLNRGRGPSGRLLSEVAFVRQSHPAIEVDLGGWSHCGYGLLMRKHGGFWHLGHDGGVPGSSARLIADLDNGLGLVLLTTTPSDRDIAWSILSLWRQSVLGQPAITLKGAEPDPTLVPEAAEFAGTFRAPDGALIVLEAEGQHLFLVAGETQVLLEQRGAGRFYAPHPAFDRFLLAAQRDAAGRVVQVNYGEHWYARDLAAALQVFQYPPEWEGFAGHYRTHNPWQTNFRVILRQGQLWLVWPAGDEERLVQVGPATFQVGVDPTPERLRFDQVADGRALCANYSACDYYRFFTP